MYVYMEVEVDDLSECGQKRVAVVRNLGTEFLVVRNGQRGFGVVSHRLGDEEAAIRDPIGPSVGNMMQASYGSQEVYGFGDPTGMVSRSGASTTM